MCEKADLVKFIEELKYECMENDDFEKAIKEEVGIPMVPNVIKIKEENEKLKEENEELKEQIKKAEDSWADETTHALKHISGFCEHLKKENEKLKNGLHKCLEVMSMTEEEMKLNKLSE